MKVSERMRKILTFLAFVLLVVLVAAQYFLQQELIAVNTQLQSTRSSAKELSRTSESRALAVSAYKALTGDAPEELYQRPENAVQFYSTVDEVLRQYGLVHSGITPQAGTDPLELGLSVEFSGPYYGFLKAMAALRQSPYLMKTTTLSLTYYTGTGKKDSLPGEGNITGKMTIVSALKN